MKYGAAARRYALALLQSVPEAEQAPVGAVLGTATRVLTGGPVWQIMKNPLVSPRAKQEIVGELVDPAHPVYRLLAIVLQNRREALLADIAEEYDTELMRRQGRLRAVVRTAQPLSEAWTKRLGDILSRRLGHELVATYEVDPTLIGGVEVRLPGQVLDGTIRGRLNRLKAQLKREV
jgi:F-type H+-transporting ATPase subunit delta